MNLTEENELEDIEEQEVLREEKRKLPFWLGILVGITAAFVAALVLVIVTGFKLQSTASGTGTAGSQSTASVTSVARYETKLNAISAYIDKYYLGDVDESTMEEALCDGLIAGLDDKYAKYYTAEEYEELVESTNGSYYGIGVGILEEEDTGKVLVTYVYDDSPAKEAGMQTGDYIIEAEGVRDFEDIDALIELVKGEEGTEVSIVVERDGEEIAMTMKRAVIETETVAWEMLDGNIGYIYIAEFDKVTTNQFNKALDELTEQGMESLILDLRYNPGGDYDTVVAMADRVLPEGVIMTVKDKSGTVITENSTNEEYIDIPMCVLVNESSASAAEVFAGAIQDYGIATIIGKTTYGKGVVQSIFRLYDGSAMKFTVEEYYTPSGDSIHGVGVIPDIEVDLPEDADSNGNGVIDLEEDTQLQAAIAELTK